MTVPFSRCAVSGVGALWECSVMAGVLFRERLRRIGSLHALAVEIDDSDVSHFSASEAVMVVPESIGTLLAFFVFVGTFPQPPVIHRLIRKGGHDDVGSGALRLLAPREERF